MLDLLTRVRTLRRPALLAKAARFGMQDYRRATHLKRILQSEVLPTHGAALAQLLETEVLMNVRRKDHSGLYRPSAHVEVLIAILCEAQLLRDSRAQQ